MNILNFYFLLLLIEFFSANDKIYRIKFGLFNPKSKESDSSFINNLFYNRIYVNLSIGTPPQILPFELDIKSHLMSKFQEKIIFIMKILKMVLILKIY